MSYPPYSGATLIGCHDVLEPLRFLALLVVTLSSAAISSESVTASGGTQAYEAGVTAARAGDHEAALEWFTAARQDGYVSPALLYNLGVVNFQLGRLSDARRAFRELIHDPDWRALAHYNLGLLDEREGAITAARRHFVRARTLSTSHRLKTLAATRLRELPKASAFRADGFWQGVTSIAGGHDDNVVLGNDRLVDEVSEEKAWFMEGLIAGRRGLGGGGDPAPVLDLAAYYRAHAQLHDFDFGAMSAGLSWQRDVGAWRVASGGRAELQFTNGDRYASAVLHRFELDRSVEEWSWRARNELGYVNGHARFDFLRGWRNRTLLELTRPEHWGALHLGYELELNDRKDFRSGETFSSHSPTRHGAYASAAIELSRRLRVMVRGSARWSRYPDENRFFDETGAIVSVARDQDTIFVDIRADYRIAPRWTVWSELQRADSDSELARYDYRSNRYLLGVEVTF